MDYKKLHKDTITKLQEMVNSGKITVEVARGICADFIPESEDEKTKKEIINYLECQSRDEPSRKDTHNKWINYIEKYALSKDDYDFLRDCARVLKTFGWQSYADRLTGLCPALGEEAKAMMSTPIIFNESEDERIRMSLIELFKDMEWDDSILHDYNMDKDKTIAWLEKQGEQKPAEVRTTGYWNVQDIEQKPAEWNRNDEVLLDETLHFIREFQQSDRCIDEGDMQNSITCENWLKSIKERVQPKQEWSEEDEKMLRGIIDDFSDELDEWTDKEEIEIITNKISFLKSLKPHPIHKWNREDNITRLEITNYLECQKREEPTRIAILNKWIAWIANLDPQGKQGSQWKPSDKQMEALNEAIYHVDDSIATQIAKLIGDLKKLKG